ncbi:MAG: hypothetical protein KA792_00655 [Bacteroidales bacterium]|nr:hypothetical protein [Bacteroidales bacterium]
MLYSGYIISCSIFILLTFNSFGQNNNAAGGRSAAMSHSSLCLEDLWSVFNNQAGLAGYGKTAAGIYCEQRYMLKDLQSKAIALAVPSKSGVFGISYSSFGFNQYSENKTGLAFSKAIFKNFSAGIQLDYLYNHIEGDYNEYSVLTFEAGILAKISKKFSFAAHIFNPVNQSKDPDTRELNSSLIKAGLLFKPIEKILITSEIEKNFNCKPQLKAGTEYNIVKNIYLRGGLSTNPVINSFGFGFYWRKIQVDFASSIHQTLGYSPQFSLVYNLK